jgi:hypothetical protein
MRCPLSDKRSTRAGAVFGGIISNATRTWNRCTTSPSSKRWSPRSKPTWRSSARGCARWSATGSWDRFLRSQRRLDNPRVPAMAERPKRSRFRTLGFPVDSPSEAIVTLVRATDFKSVGGCGNTTSAGSIPVRFRHQGLNCAPCPHALRCPQPRKWLPPARRSAEKNTRTLCYNGDEGLSWSSWCGSE